MGPLKSGLKAYSLTYDAVTRHTYFQTPSNHTKFLTVQKYWLESLIMAMLSPLLTNSLILY